MRFGPSYSDLLLRENVRGNENDNPNDVNAVYEMNDDLHKHGTNKRYGTNRPDPFNLSPYSNLLLKEDTREFTNSPLEHGAFVDGVKNDMHQAARSEPSVRQPKNNSELSVALPNGKTYKASVETSMDGIGSKMKHTVKTWTE